MSVWKWRRVYEIAVEQGVVRHTLAGINRLNGQFFLNIPDSMIDDWKKSCYEYQEDDTQQVCLTNRRNLRRFERIAEKGGQNPHTMELLVASINLAHHIIADGLFLPSLLHLATAIRKKETVDADLYIKWVDQLHMERILPLENCMLKLLFNSSETFLPSSPTDDDIARAEDIFDRLFSKNHAHSGQLHFTQNGNDIFVHTSNSRAMLWQARRSAQFFRYYPSEGISSLIQSFKHSLTDIEE